MVSVFQFHPASSLKPYMLSIEPRLVTIANFTLHFLLHTLHHIIDRDSLSDPTNPSIIVCSKEMKLALQMPALHRIDLFCVVRQHLIPVTPGVPIVIRTIPTETISNPSTSRFDKAIVYQSEKIKDQGATSFYARVPHLKLRLEFWNFLSLYVPSFPTDKNLFRYEEICGFVSQYVRLHQHILYTPGNYLVIKVKDTPLGALFKVNYIHRSQINHLIRQHIYEFYE